MPFPVLALCSPSQTTTTMASIKLPRPRGLWKAARETPKAPPTQLDDVCAAKRPSPPQDDHYYYYVNATIDRENIFSNEAACCGQRKPATISTSTSTAPENSSSSATATIQDSEVIFWDYSRKCDPQPERLTKWITRAKVMITSSVASLGQQATTTTTKYDRSSSSNSSGCGLEDWEDLKELFSKAVETYETEEASEAIPVLRGVIHECHRFMRVYPDPSVVYATPPSSSQADNNNNNNNKSSKSAATIRLEERLPREWMVDPPPLYPPPPPSSGSSSSSSKNQGKDRQQSHEMMTPLKEKKCQCKDLPTAFYTVFGTTLFLFGNLIARDRSLALQGEPSAPTPYWLSAIDVFQIGENLPIRLSGRGCASAPEDWRMAVVWGRTLVNLADEILTRTKNNNNSHSHSHSHAHAPPPPLPTTSDRFPGMLTFSSVFAPPSSSSTNNNNNNNMDDPIWPTDSPFALIVARRPPSSCRLSLNNSTAIELLHLAQDQFYRGIFHMPHQRGTRNQRSPTTTTTTTTATGSEAAFSSSLLSTSSTATTATTTPATTTTSTTTTSTTTFSQAAQPLASTFSLTKELYTIGSEMLLVAEKLDAPSDRFQWASWADGIFGQMKLEHSVSNISSSSSDNSSGGGSGGTTSNSNSNSEQSWKTTLITIARGRSCLVMGSARAEEMDGALEAGDLGVLDTEEAEEAREVLRNAVAFLDRARAMMMVVVVDSGAGAGAATTTKPLEAAAAAAAASSSMVVELEAQEDLEDEAEIQAIIDNDDGGSSVMVTADAEQQQQQEPEESHELAELRTLLAEALLTLANLTRDAREREALYARAHKEGRGAFEFDGGDDDDDDDRMDEDD